MSRILSLTLSGILGLVGCDNLTVTNIQPEGEIEGEYLQESYKETISLTALLNNERNYFGKRVVIEGVPLACEAGRMACYMSIILGTGQPLEDDRRIIAYFSSSDGIGYIDASVAVKAEIDDGDKQPIYVTGTYGEDRRLKIESIVASGYRIAFNVQRLVFKPQLTSNIHEN